MRNKQIKSLLYRIPLFFYKKLLYLYTYIYSDWMRCAFKECHTSVIFEGVRLLVGPQYISIGKGTTFQYGLYLTAWDRYRSQSFTPNISIGESCAIGAYNHITCINKITIGNGLLTGKWVTITDNSHGKTNLEDLNIIPSNRKLFTKGDIIIGNNVWLGDKVTILSGVTIGDGVVIAANSVVVSNIPKYCIAAGNPARVVKNNN